MIIVGPFGIFGGELIMKLATYIINYISVSIFLLQHASATHISILLLRCKRLLQNAVIALTKTDLTKSLLTTSLDIISQSVAKHQLQSRN